MQMDQRYAHQVTDSSRVKADVISSYLCADLHWSEREASFSIAVMAFSKISNHATTSMRWGVPENSKCSRNSLLTPRWNPINPVYAKVRFAMWNFYCWHSPLERPMPEFNTRCLLSFPFLFLAADGIPYGDQFQFRYYTVSVGIPGAGTFTQTLRRSVELSSTLTGAHTVTSDMDMHGIIAKWVVRRGANESPWTSPPYES